MSIEQPFLAATLMCAALVGSTAVAGTGSDSKPLLYEGVGRGFVVMPTVQLEGSFFGDLLDERGQAAFTIEASMTSAVPTTTFGPGVRVLYGGIHGWVREAAPVGSGSDADLPIVALVEGYWMLENNYTGTYELSTYERRENGTLRYTGSVAGDLVVHDMPEHDVDEKDPTTLDAHKFASLLQAKKKASSLSAGSGTSPAPQVAPRVNRRWATFLSDRKRLAAQGSGGGTSPAPQVAPRVNRRWAAFLSDRKRLAAQGSGGGPAPTSPQRKATSTSIEWKSALAIDNLSGPSKVRVGPSREASADTVMTHPAFSTNGSNDSQGVQPLTTDTRPPAQPSVTPRSGTATATSVKGLAFVPGGGPSPVEGLRMGFAKMSYRLIH